jgi:WD40 repeat protein
MARSKLLSTDPKLRGWEFEYLLSKSKEERLRWGLPGKLEGRVSRMKFADNERVVLARHSSESEAGEVSIWDFANEKVTPLDFPPGYYVALAVSRDGNLIAAAGRTGKVTVWNVEKGEIVQRYSGHNPDPKITSTSREFLRVGTLDFSPDGKRIVSTAVGAPGIEKVHAFKVWSIETGQDLITIAGQHQEEKGRPISSVCFSPDGKTIASGGFDGAITLWDAESGKELRKIKGPLVNVLCLEFSPNSKRLACGSINSAIWDPATGKQLVPLVDYRNPVASITFSPDGKRLVTGGWDKTVRIWDAGTGVQLLLLETLGNHVDSVTMSPDGKSIAAGGPQGRAIPKPIVWSIRTVAAAQNSGDDNATAIKK